MVPMEYPALVMLVSSNPPVEYLISGTPGASAVTRFLFRVILKEVFHLKFFPEMGFAFKVNSKPLLYMVPTLVDILRFGTPVDPDCGTSMIRPSMLFLYQAISPEIMSFSRLNCRPMSVFLLVSQVRLGL